MKRCWSLVLLAAAFVAAAQGQAPDRTVLARSGTESPLSVPYQKTLQLPVAGATAAYSLDSNIVDATAANGVVEIVGKGPGSHRACAFWDGVSALRPRTRKHG